MVSLSMPLSEPSRISTASRGFVSYSWAFLFLELINDDDDDDCISFSGGTAILATRRCRFVLFRKQVNMGMTLHDANKSNCR